jgi:hypothetical protein
LQGEDGAVGHLKKHRRWRHRRSGDSIWFTNMGEFMENLQETMVFPHNLGILRDFDGILMGI